MIITGGKSSAVDHLESQADYAPNKILSRRKPIFINEKRWNSIRTKALGNKIKDTYGSINKAESYKLLCLSGKVDYVTEEEWLSLKQKAIELLTNRLKTEINTASWHTEILELLSIEKPSLFPDKEWAELQNKMNESYFALKAKEGRFFSDSNSTLKEIEQPKPNGILDDFWVEYIENLKKEYFKQLSKDLEFSATPLHFIKQQNLRVLSDGQVDTLETRAYKLEINKMPRLFNKLTAQQFLESKNPNGSKMMIIKQYEKQPKPLLKRIPYHFYFGILLITRHYLKQNPKSLLKKSGMRCLKLHNVLKRWRRNIALQ